jgi:S-adenosylmethionine decarboxylase
MDQTRPLGRHLVVDVWGEVDSMPFWDMDGAAEALKRAANEAGATVITERWHHFGDGHGYTGVIVLAESHISVHTWPEHGSALIDAFMCGDCDPMDCLDTIKQFYRAQKCVVHYMERGQAKPLI